MLKCDKCCIGKSERATAPRIQFLGGEVDLTGKWNPLCTHVVALNFEFFHEKVKCTAALCMIIFMTPYSYLPTSLARNTSRNLIYGVDMCYLERK